MSKRKRRIRGSLYRELWKMFYKTYPRNLLNQYQKYTDVVCGLLEIPSPELRWCESSLQGECIERKGGKNPCGGACYTEDRDRAVIYLRNHFIYQPLINHEIFHHINKLNTNVQETVIDGWLIHQNQIHKVDFHKMVKEALAKNGKK